jgi:hypothetical protein
MFKTARDMSNTERLVALHGPDSPTNFGNSLSRARSDMFRRTKKEMQALSMSPSKRAPRSSGSSMGFDSSTTSSNQAWGDPEMAKTHKSLRKEFGVDWKGSTQKQIVARAPREHENFFSSTLATDTTGIEVPEMARMGIKNPGICTMCSATAEICLDCTVHIWRKRESGFKEKNQQIMQHLFSTSATRSNQMINVWLKRVCFTSWRDLSVRSRYSRIKLVKNFQRMRLQKYWYGWKSTRQDSKMVACMKLQMEIESENRELEKQVVMARKELSDFKEVTDAEVKQLKDDQQGDLDRANAEIERLKKKEKELRSTQHKLDKAEARAKNAEAVEKQLALYKEAAMTMMDTGMDSLQRFVEEVVNTEGRHDMSGVLSKKTLATLTSPASPQWVRIGAEVTNLCIISILHSCSLHSTIHSCLLHSTIHSCSLHSTIHSCLLHYATQQSPNSNTPCPAEYFGSDNFHDNFYQNCQISFVPCPPRVCIHLAC